MAEAVETKIEAMGAGGDGIAPGPLFIPWTLPGERVRATPGAKGRARLEEVLAPSPERVAPPCVHFGPCGGCALQHWSLDAYAEWKRSRLVEALSRAGFPDAPVAPAFVTPRNSRRRVDWGLERQADGSVAIGFHERHGTALVPMQECHILRPELVALLGPLAAALRGLEGLRRLGTAVVNWLDTGADLRLDTDGPLTEGDRRRLAAFAAEQGIPRIAWRNEVAAQRGAVAVTLAGVSVAPPSGAFLQATPEGEATIIAAVLAALPSKMPPRARLADLYAGIGTLSFPLGSRGVVDAFESDTPAVEALKRAAGGGRVRAQRRDLVRQPLLPLELKPYAAVVLDPPFNGAVDQVAQIARSAVRRVIYVSCNPAALSRDGAALRAAGFEVESAVPVDQFLWSPHLESVVAFTR
ncbi:class I SAM-dependent RNA methyltransferase [Sabulicella glaciei]|uniref:Class I SAM-dependent RNA methyltransferase n=1 Tax=Sabulicella glaciei TaxID=2984948 RepID=A0ABT3NZP0_9PROT|nr:class I SAM-dependent RNA methyltransferase [Roseococcus sp. MDT2-1-1]MCW8087637.1 class I SAM-dependent RNA methyltransferase [Roseococcus sp. MDT2-1-1]